MLLVTKGKGRINQLGYDLKKGEYVYFHNGKEIWREKGDTSLLDYFNEVRACIHCCDDDDIEKLTTANIWKKYDDSCFAFEKEERGW